MAEFGTSSAFRGWVRVRVLGYGFGVRGRKVKSRDCALASDLVRAACFTDIEQEMRVNSGDIINIKEEHPKISNSANPKYAISV